MSKVIVLVVIIIIVVAAIIYWAYRPAPEEPPNQEQACLDAGGTVTTSLCCKTMGDFPNTCLVGSCACAPENSHEVKSCYCGENKCFDGEACITLDEVSIFLRNLTEETGINFSEAKPAEFQWAVGVEPTVQEIDIQGKEIEVEGISTEQEMEIESFFINNGFEKDPYNIADGTVVGLVGYKKEQAVCVVISGATGYKEAEGDWIPPDPATRDIDIKCGKLEVTP